MKNAPIATSEQKEEMTQYIEASLEDRLSHLREIDQVKARNLNMLKGHILAEINDGDDPKTTEREGYLNDLWLTREELGEVYKSTAVNALCVDYGITSLEAFEEFIGLGNLIGGPTEESSNNELESSEDETTKEEPKDLAALRKELEQFQGVLDANGIEVDRDNPRLLRFPDEFDKPIFFIPKNLKLFSIQIHGESIQIICDLPNGDYRKPDVISRTGYGDREERKHINEEGNTVIEWHNINNPDEFHMIELTPNGDLLVKGEISEQRKKEIEKYNPETGEKTHLETYRSGGTKESIRDYSQETTDFFDENGNRTFQRQKGESVMFTESGEEYGLLSRHPALSPDAYLDMLADNLSPVEKLAIFMEQMMRYVYDSANPNDPLEKGTAENKGEYWQTPLETAQRMEKGCMLGDCDDYANLAKEILKRQGKNAVTICIPGHAICAWTEKRPDGKYDAYSIGTFGLDKNGNQYGMKVDPKKEKGYGSVQEALNSLMVKYRSGGLGLVIGTNYKVGDMVKVGGEPGVGGWDVEHHHLPTFILEDAKFCDRLLEAQKKKDNSALAQLYVDLSIKYPDYSILCHEKAGSCYHLQCNDKDNAIKQYQEAIKLGTKNKDTYYSLGQFYSSGEERIQIMEMALKNVSPPSDQVLLDLGRAYSDCGRFDEAIQILNEGFTQFPESSSNIQMALGYVQNSMARKVSKAKSVL